MRKKRVTKEIDEWAKQSLPLLKEYGYLKKNGSLLYVFVAFIVGLMISSVMFYGIYYDKFKSDIAQDVTLEQNISNDYEFNPTTNNEYDHYISNNFTIYVNNIMPDYPTP